MAASLLTVGLLHQSGFFGDILNGLMFLAYLSDELLWRLVVLDYAEVSEFGGHRRFLNRLFNRRHQRLRDLRRHSGGRKEAEPDAEQVLAIAELRQGWDIGVIREVTRYDDPPQRSTLQMAAQRPQRERHALHMPAQDRTDTRGPAFERHHRHPGSSERVHHLDVEMAG